MKTRLSIFAMLLCSAMFFLSSCGEDEDNTQPDCEKNQYGTVVVSNTSSNPYDFYIDNVFQIRINGGSITQEIQINEGNSRELYAIQVSGFVLYPTEKTTNLNVVRCTDYSWQIP